MKPCPRCGAEDATKSAWNEWRYCRCGFTWEQGENGIDTYCDGTKDEVDVPYGTMPVFKEATE